MASCVAELDALLQSMGELKPPGVSGAKVTSMTALCVANVKSESILIQKIYTHYKKARGDKKLGVLYVVDSVVRQWLDLARKARQEVGPDASEGSYASAVQHVTELMPSFMSDIANAAPESQKAKIVKLVEIWDRGSTFPPQMLNGFRERLSSAVEHAQSTTPSTTPPSTFATLNGAAPAAAAAATAALAPATQQPRDTSSILAALAGMVKQQSTAAPMATTTAPLASSNVSFPPQNTFSPVNPVAGQAVNPPGLLNGVFTFPGMNGLQQPPFNQPPSVQPVAMAPMPAMPAIPPAPPSIPTGLSPEALQQQLQLLAMLKAQGVPQDQWAAVLSVLMATAGAAAPVAPAPTPSYHGFGADASRDRNGYRSPRGNRNRSRSRSPTGWDRRRDVPSPPRRRDSPVYGDYGGDRNGHGRGDRGDRGDRRRGGGNPYRQRSPDKRRSPSPRRPDPSLPPPGPKYMEIDPNVGQGNIKVLSRTLFVGGVTSSEESLRKIFSVYGRVQTCIVNVDKRHAFVKMITRDEAAKAKAGMEHYKSSEMQLRTRWGVGFGPRDCSDYQTGISIIPLERLTDADRKWLVTADFGGTGGKPIVSCIVVEEPDIEIGAGVSSKAISRRMQTDKSGNQGPRSTREPPSSSDRSRFRNGDFNSKDGGGNHGIPPSSANATPIGGAVAVAAAVPPAVPGFGFQFPLMPNGMPVLPPGFLMPGSVAPPQPPPPGAG